MEDPSARVVEGECVEFHSIPGYQGPLGFTRNILPIIKTCLKEAFHNDMVILRLPATIPMLIGLLRTLLRKPFAVELVGDPLDAYSSDSLRRFGSSFWQWLFVNCTRILCAKAVGCAYVTKHRLQQRYPSKKSFHYTSLDISNSQFAPGPKEYTQVSQAERIRPRLIMVAMMQNYYKGHDIAIQALKELHRTFTIEAELEFIGDGPIREELVRMVDDLGLSNYVAFSGKLSSGARVHDRMRMAHLLILPSRQEGLPRVVIEAMAQGIVCLATDVGGTSELLSEPQLYSGELDALSFAKRLYSLLSNWDSLSLLAHTNYVSAAEYQLPNVQRKREAFYNLLSST